MSNNPLLFDNHGRPLTYLRLSVTDRCNLRCFYCMPEEGIHYLPQKALLTYEEMERLVKLLVGMGINKVRITGGEPFVRKSLIQFLARLSNVKGLQQINITTNGVLTGKYISELKAMGIRSINLSIDSLNRKRFHEITRRDELPVVLETLHALLQEGFDVKLNTVVMEGKNTEDIAELVALTEKHPLDVRFIEEMPFNGEGHFDQQLQWNQRRILAEIQKGFPALAKLPTLPNSTSTRYQIPGHTGKVGIIAAFSRTFCGSCNRIRITAQGTLKTCLYDGGVLDLKSLMRAGASDEALRAELLKAFRTRPKDGFAAEKQRDEQHQHGESMSTIGG